MARKNNTAAPPHIPTGGGTQIREFLTSNFPLETLRQRTENLLSNKDLVRNIQAMTPEDQTKFLDKVDQVCQGIPLLRNFWFNISTKAYPTLNPQNSKHINSLGNLCGAVQLLPTSAVISTGLKKRGAMALASGGLTDIWRGVLDDTQVAIKAFRIYPAPNLKDAKKVSKRSTCGLAHEQNL